MALNPESLLLLVNEVSAEPVESASGRAPGVPAEVIWDHTQYVHCRVQSKRTSSMKQTV
jgi:hypothetical protein